MNAPEVVTYDRTKFSDTAPQVVGYVTMNGQFLCVRFEGATAAEVERKALAWWRAEEEAAQKREEGLDARRAAAAEAREKRAAEKASKAELEAQQ